jgi:hypothetical protein
LISAVLASAASGPGKPTPLVGVYYFPGWYRGKADPTNQSSEWRRCIMKTPQPRPVCGFYDDADPRLWSYYIDWMTQYGGDFLAFDWYYNAGKFALEESLEKGFLGCESNGKVRFALHWCNHPLGWKLDQSRPELLRMVDVASARYFTKPNYLRVDGRPVFMIYDVDQLLAFGGFDAVKSGLKAMRGRAAKHGFGGLYLVAVYSRVSASYVQVCRDLGFDAFCAYTYVGTRYPPIRWDSQNIPYGTCVANCVENIYPFLSRIGREKGIAYWPTTFPGWDDRPRAGLEKAFVTEGNTPERFGQMFRGALGFADPATPIVMVEAWNEWGEGACIEPDKKYGFGYLDEIARARGRTPAKPRVPSSGETASWRVLTPEEIAVARSIEGQAWEPKKPIYLDAGRNRQTAPVKLPITLDLRAGAVDIQVYGGKIERRDDKGVLFVSESNDSQLIVRTPDIPTSQIKRVTLYTDVPKGGSEATVSLELFFHTALYPQSSAFCSAQVGPLRSSRASVATADIMGWDKFGTPLTAIRIDPGQQPGARVLLRSVRIE